MVRCGMEHGLGRCLGQVGVKHLHCYLGRCVFWTCLSFTLVQEYIFQSTSCIGQVLNWRKMSEREQLKAEGNRSKTIYVLI